MTADPDTLRALIARLEAGETGQELCARIVAATLAPVGSVVEQSPFNGRWVIYAGLDHMGNPDIWSCKNAVLREAYLNGDLLTSVDAAIAFTEAVLPGWFWLVSPGAASVGSLGLEHPEWMSGEADRIAGCGLAHALVLATLKAKLAEAEGRS